MAANSSKSVAQRLERMRANIRTCFLGNAQAVDRVIICLLAKGHLLIEDVPGVGKTMLATSLAKSIDGTMSRIQLTPDMLPADVLGVTIWDQNASDFTFKPGPIFSNIVLADEINRTTPRTQSALLEAMNEAQVSIDGHTRKLIQPFIVIATQNPFEFEGTYFLPESQLDRFLIRIRLGYPSQEDEVRILQIDPSRTALPEIEPAMTSQQLVEIQNAVETIEIDRALLDYIVAIADATRRNDQLEIGVSPRGALALTHAAKATALYHDRDYVVPDDIVSNVVPVFAHRVISKSYMHDTNGLSNHQVIQQILETVPSPV